jgi:multidrug resistance efflux pump
MDIKFKSKKEQNSNLEKGVNVLYTNSKRSGYTIRWFVILFIVISPILYIAWLYVDSFFINKAQGIITYQPITIYSKNNVTVIHRYIDIGDIVSNKQELFLLDDKSLDNELNYLNKELKDNSNNLKNLPLIKISNYEKSIEEAQNNLNEIEKIKKHYEGYLDKGQISLIDYANVINVYYSAKNNLNKQKIIFNQTKLSNKEAEHISPLNSIKSKLQKEIYIKKFEKENLLIQSPFQGQIIEIFTKEGQQLIIGEPIYRISKISKIKNPEIIAFVKPEYINYIQKDNIVSVSLPNGLKIKGVIKIEPQISTKLPPQLQKPFDNNIGLLKIIIKIDNIDNYKLPEGLPVMVFF